MKALVFGTSTAAVDAARRTPLPCCRTWPSPRSPSRTSPDARPLRPDWFVTRPLLTGICGSDSKQILLDFGDGDSDNAMSGLCSFPQVMGHEVVAEVDRARARGRGLRRRPAGGAQPVAVVRAPRASARSAPPARPATCSLCWSFAAGDISTGIHTGVSSDATGGYAELMPAHSDDALRRPRRDRRRARHLRRPVRGVAAQHHPPPAARRRPGRSCGAPARSARARSRSCARSTPTSRSAWSPASTPRPTWPRKLGAHQVFRLGTPAGDGRGAGRVVGRRAPADDGGPAAASRCATPAASTSPTTRSASRRPSRSRCACSRPAARS